MKKKYLLSFLSVFVIHCLFLLFWIITTKAGAVFFVVYVTLSELLVDILLSLGVVIFLFIKSINKRWFVLEIIFSLIAGFFGTFFHYFNWGITTKNFLAPDSETVWIFEILFVINLVSILCLGIIFQVILFIKNRKVK